MLLMAYVEKVGSRMPIYLAFNRLMHSMKIRALEIGVVRLQEALTFRDGPVVCKDSITNAEQASLVPHYPVNIIEEIYVSLHKGFKEENQDEEDKIFDERQTKGRFCIGHL